MVRLGDGFEALQGLEVQIACLCGLPAGPLELLLAIF